MCKKSLRLTQAIEWAHLFTQPVYVPLVYGKEFFGLAGGFAAQVSKRQTRRDAPKAAEFLDTIGHSV